MVKTEINYILTEAKMALDDIVHRNIARFLSKGQHNALRMYLSDMLEMVDIRATLDPDNLDVKEERKALNRIEDVVLEYCINNADAK